MTTKKWSVNRMDNGKGFAVTREETATESFVAATTDTVV